MKATLKGFGLIAAALALALLLWALLRPELVSVESARVAERTLTVTIEEQGRTRARDPFIVAAPIAGRLLRPAFKAGDEVTTGTELAHIAVAPDDRRTGAMAEAGLAAALARRTAAEAAVREAESSHARARNEEERRAELAKTGVATAEELEFYRQTTDSAEARLLSLRASAQAAEAEVERARAQLLGSTPDTEEGILSVPAPVDGTIYRVFEESERVVAAGTPLYALSRENELEIVVDLVTQDAVRVAAGQALLLTGWGGDETLHGNVVRVEPQAFTKISALGVEEQRVNVIGSLQALPPGLGAEYRVDAAIVVWEQDVVLTAPASAVFRRAGSWQAFVVEAGRARLRTLEIGQRNRDYVQVLGGLAAGDEVIVFPSDLIADGVRVVVED
jgi:HlyD family secretion protein